MCGEKQGLVFCVCDLLLLLLGAVAHLQIHAVVFSLFTVNLRFFVIDYVFQVLRFTKIKAVVLFQVLCITRILTPHTNKITRISVHFIDPVFGQ